MYAATRLNLFTIKKCWEKNPKAKEKIRNAEASFSKTSLINFHQFLLFTSPLYSIQNLLFLCQANPPKSVSKLSIRSPISPPLFSMTIKAQSYKGNSRFSLLPSCYKAFLGWISQIPILKFLVKLSWIPKLSFSNLNFPTKDLMLVLDLAF